MSFPASIERDGFAIVSIVLDAAECAALIRSVAVDVGDTDREGVAGVRNLLSAVPAVRTLATSDRICALVEPVLGADCFPVRGILFDKTPGSNWKVPWHQDRTIAVREKRVADGFGPWSEKEGVTHVQPPAEILEQMLAVRLHLDPCGIDNGPVRVLPGTHRDGKLPAICIQELRQNREPVDCIVDAGGALLMRPLLLHASSAAASPAHRRVLHIEYANADLPGGLEWYGRDADSAHAHPKMCT